jgi:hypothetical protein
LLLFVYDFAGTDVAAAGGAAVVDVAAVITDGADGAEAVTVAATGGAAPAAVEGVDDVPCDFCSIALFLCSFLVIFPAAFASAVVGGLGITLVTLPTAFVRPSRNTRRWPI